VAFNQVLQDHFNAQFNREMYSSYLYLAMAAYFEANNYHGFAHWMKLQADEEREHGMKFFGYILERGGKVALDKIDKPPLLWESPLAAFEQVYKHEQEITKNINGLIDAAMAQNDHAAHSFLLYFADEQVEEEAQVLAICERLKTVAGSAGSLFWMDKEAGKRAGDSK
jgi:ferritin